MPTETDQFTDPRRAYQLLGLPISASAPAIKRAYRSMTRRWHPDLYPAGSPEHAEATQMMKSINKAYDAIQRAPLRYRPPSAVDPQSQTTEADRVIQSEPVTFVATDRLEFWIRFICGAFLGIFSAAAFALKLWVFHPSSPVLIGGASVLVIIGFGLASAYGGDRFWYRFFGVRGW